MAGTGWLESVASDSRRTAGRTHHTEVDNRDQLGYNEPTVAAEPFRKPDRAPNRRAEGSGLGVRRATSVAVACGLAVALLARAVRAIDDAPPENLEVQIYAPTPVETEIVSRKRIADLPAQDVADVTKTMTGVRTQSRVQGQEAAAAVEGMPAEYTKLLVNGGTTRRDRRSGRPRRRAGEERAGDSADPRSAGGALRLGRGRSGALEVETIRSPATDDFNFAFEGGAGNDRAALRRAEHRCALRTARRHPRSDVPNHRRADGSRQPTLSS